MGEASKTDKTDKNAKRDLKRLQERARAALDSGDYRSARALYAELKNKSAGTEVAKLAEQELELFHLDTWVVRIGLGAVALYVLAWMAAL